MKQERSIQVGSRGSRLALVQVEEIKALLSQAGESVSFDSKVYKTQGDKDKTTPLADHKISDDFFTDGLDQAVLNGDIDIAIHSAKDLPQKLKDGLEVFALTRSQDDTDCLAGQSSLTQLKPGAVIGTSSALRKKFMEQNYPQFTLKEIRGTIEERIKQIEDGAFHGVVMATIALKRLGLEKYMRDIFPWEGFPLQGQLAVVGRAEDLKNKELFSKIDVRRAYGKVTLVGAGPGDAGLITVNGANALKKCDCVFYDFLVNEELLNYAPFAEKIFAGKRKGAHSLKQEDLNRKLKEKAFEGKNIVRLKGGDPLIFGRGADEIEYLQSYHIDVDVIPGVSSSTGILSSLGIPLTKRGVSSSVAFVSGHGQAEDEKSKKEIEIPKADTIIFLMGLTKLSIITETLRNSGWGKDKPMMVISKGTRTDQTVVIGTVGTIEQKVGKGNIQPPALIVAGETIRSWNLSHRQGKVLYLGTHPEKYRTAGRLIHLPMIKIRKKELSEVSLKELVQKTKGCDLIVLTSRFAVKYYLENLISQKYPFSQLSTKEIAVIGRDTAEALSYYDLTPNLVSQVETSQGLFESLSKKYSLKGLKVVFPRSSLSNPFLKEALRQSGAQVDEVTLYENDKPEKQELPAENIEKIVFTSPSTVRNFIKDYGKIPEQWKILSKGPKTSEELKKQGYNGEVEVYESL